MNWIVGFINTLMVQGRTLKVPMGKGFEALEAQTLVEV